MKKSTKNALVISGVATVGIAALVGIYHTTAKILMKVALEREEPKLVKKGKERLISSGDFKEIMEKLSEASEKLEAKPHETVEIKAYDGTRLVGHWYGTPNAKRVIVAMHGWRSSWSADFGLIADFWHQNDCAVLYAEQRGQGTSGGDYMGFGLLERYDCFEWIKWVNERTNSQLPVYLGGISMGATTVLMTAGFNLPENVKGIVADCGFTSPKAIWKHVVQSNFHLPFGLYKKVADDICKKRLQVDSSDYTCAEALENSDIPVLFIHGTDDRFVPIDMTFENYKACKSPKELLVVVGAEHGMSYLVDQASYETKVKEFWQKYDT